MFLRLTDINGNLILVNLDKVADFSYEKYSKTEYRYAVYFIGGTCVYVQETVSEISQLLQSAGKVVK